jgi:hypothetical protein
MDNAVNVRPRVELPTTVARSVFTHRKKRPSSGASRHLLPAPRGEGRHPGGDPGSRRWRDAGYGKRLRSDAVSGSRSPASAIPTRRPRSLCTCRWRTRMSARKLCRSRSTVRNPSKAVRRIRFCRVHKRSVMHLLQRRDDRNADGATRLTGFRYTRRVVSAIRRNCIGAQSLVSGTASMQSKAPPSKQKASTLMPMASTPVIDNSAREARSSGIQAKSSSAGVVDVRRYGSRPRR